MSFRIYSFVSVSFCSHSLFSICPSAGALLAHGIGTMENGDLDREYACVFLQVYRVFCIYCFFLERGLERTRLY